ncbi:SGNH/GDSL hydrolase family protein [Pseudonocardia abyssalis]|uniref:SGNH/GDSL hydrolase family protein n=1 Tax=Pseudonocardia abyssalis TaxID=2792008 RepID=A0ABS6UKT9_9PSEU|nr:SGNH/GDSL hydrolase family protein [Pseudonocardia abyssalis]MBW0117800.1 SGNH/GDSL hydrolase family protein [Pseudonocardia abyssalis]MBW0132843.1 SGNH/GDSL hydrolase family protein [Pseudonocardia abyssalis]
MSNGKHRLAGMGRRARLAIVGGAAVALTIASVTVPAVGREASAEPKGDGNWVSAWSAAPQGPTTLGSFGVEVLSGTQQAGALQDIVPPPTTFSDETVRQVLYLHHGGSAVRVQLSNEFGDRDATFPAVTVGVRDGDSGAAVEPGTQREVTFDGEPAVTIPQGATVLSDPVDLATEAFDHLVLSMFVPAGNGAATVHGSHMQTFFTASGDATADEGDGDFAERGIVLNNYTSTFTTASYYATGVQVEGEPGDRTLVAFGDSITDGFLSTGNTDSRYPDVLARRLKADPDTAHLSVTSQAISGGRVTGDGIGPSALARIDEQILAQPNLGGVIFLQGINDLGTALLQGPPATADDLITAYREIAERVHAAGVPIYIGTLTPAGNLLRPTPYGVYSTPSQVAERNAANEWLRTEGREIFDGVVDFDAAIRDPLVPDWIALQYDSLDNLHPNDAGYRLMAESIPQEFLDEIAAG